MEIDLNAIGFLSNTTSAFLKKDPALLALVPDTHPFHSAEIAIQLKRNFPAEKRQTLVNVLKEQYDEIGLGDNSSINTLIESLNSPNTYTVTTGQQLHLFMGPAFMVYKLLSAVKAAEAYQQQFPDCKFLPVFWLASEDHDFEEIKNTPVLGQQYPWVTNQTGACGEFHLKDISTVFDPLFEKFKSDAVTTELLKKFEVIYTSSETLSEATRKLTHLLFGEYGLLCIEPNHKALKNLFKPTIQKEIFEHKSEHLFNSFGSVLEQANFHLQLKARPVNLFYLTKGNRNRIELKDETYFINSTEIQFSKEEMAAEIEFHPERFSPNAVLRPVYQESILPNIAYIGGNAEINYWLQLTSIFAHHGVSGPALILRQSVWSMRQKQWKLLESNNLTPLSLFKAEGKMALLALIEKDNLENPLDNILTNFLSIKKSAQDTIHNMGLSNLNQLSELGKQYEKALKDAQKQGNEKLLEKKGAEFIKIEQLKNELFNLTAIQERVTSSLEYLIKAPAYINFCSKNLDFKPGYGFFLIY
ncbi:MAG: bacillithiol biosynthesis cysteine-adding enzyme BshC [Bacteroidota bacterium]